MHGTFLYKTAFSLLAVATENPHFLTQRTTMSFDTLDFTTTYEYRPLQSPRHIRLLEITHCANDENLFPDDQRGLQAVQHDGTDTSVGCDADSSPSKSRSDAIRNLGYTYRIVHTEMPPDDEDLDFEALSYTWGDPQRV